MVETRLIRTVLNPAVGLWLRSQVAAAAEIHFQLDGGDRQLVGGQIGPVTVSGRAIVYQGLHLSAVKLMVEKIRINLGQILRGKPLRLLEPIRAWGQLQLQETDLNASIASPLLGAVLEELLDQWATPLRSLNLLDATESHWEQIQIQFQNNALILQTQLRLSSQDAVSLTLQAQVTLSDPQTIVLQGLDWICERSDIQAALAQTDRLTIALGSDAAMQTLTLEPGQVICEMEITIRS
jgi:hypothetical protein